MIQTRMRPRPGRLTPLFIVALAAIACGGTREVHVVYVTAEASAPNGGVSEPSVVAEAPAAPESVVRTVAPDEVSAGTSTMQESSEPPTAASGAVSWEEAPTLRFTTGPWAGCAVKRYHSGWIVGQCGGLELFMQAGFAATTGPVTLRGVAGDRVGGFVHPRRVVIDGRSTPAADIVRRERKRVETAIGHEMRLDREGRILHRGLHARVRTPESGAVGVTCHSDLGVWDERACIGLLQRVASHGPPGGPVTERELSVAGVSLDFSGERCWAPEPGEVYCFLDGGMRFARGTAARMDALREESIRRAPLAPRTEAERQESADRLNENRERIHVLAVVSELERTGRVTTTEAPTFDPDDLPRMRVERSEHSCRIGGVASACTRVDYYGALDHVVEYAYYARVPSAEGETLVHCRQAYDEPAPSPCRQVFGGFIVPPAR